MEKECVHSGYGGKLTKRVTEKRQPALTSGCCQVTLDSVSTRQDHFVTDGLMRPYEFQAGAPCIQREHPRSSGGGECVGEQPPGGAVQRPSPTFGKQDLKENIIVAIVDRLFILRGSSKAASFK